MFLILQSSDKYLLFSITRKILNSNSTEAEKAIDKIQHAVEFVLDNLKINDIWQSSSQQHAKWGKSKTISPKIWNETRMLTLSILIYIE